MGLVARSKPIRWGLVIAGLISLLLLVGCYEQPPYSKASGEQVHLVNNRAATDPTWARLQDFLLGDSTDDSKYTYSFVCGDFAEALHNKAEAAGIKTAFVVVDFAEGEPHALNAFLTSDYGLVYIDCTGEDTTLKYTQTPYLIKLRPEYADPEFIEEGALPEYSVEYDKIAFISEGSPIELVSLGWVEYPTTYGYERYQQGIEDFNRSRSSYESQLDSYNSRAKSYYRDWAEYNAKVEAWNSGSLSYSYSDGGSFYAGFTKDLSYSQLVREQKRLQGDYEYLESECSRLTIESNKLLNTLQVLGYYSWDTLGVIKSIKIWW
jgi:hypothetical protein